MGHFTFWISPFAQRKRYSILTAGRKEYVYIYYHGNLHVLKYLLLLY